MTSWFCRLSKDDQERRLIGMVRRLEIAGAYLRYMHAPLVPSEAKHCARE